MYFNLYNLIIIAELKVAICDDCEKALQLMKSKSNLEYIIIIDKINDAVQAKANEMNIKLYTFEQLKEIGRNNIKKPVVS